VIKNHDYAVLARRFLEAVRGGPFDDLPAAARPDLVPADGAAV
jgi:hypothetical protein